MSYPFRAFGPALALSFAVMLGLAPNAFGQSAPEYCASCNTDFDGDGDTDQADQAIFEAATGTTSDDPAFNAACDCNGDGVIGGPDWACVAAAVAAE